MNPLPGLLDMGDGSATFPLHSSSVRFQRLVGTDRFTPSTILES